MNKRYLTVALIFIAFAFNGCGVKKIDGQLDNEYTPKSEVLETKDNIINPTFIITPEPEANNEFAVNPLTGTEDMDKTNLGKRPVAIMFSNIKQATPQIGINSADIYYEIEAEGGITRIMALFADINKVPNLIGPIRSTRESFVEICSGHDAILTHYGSSDIAEKTIINENIDNLDGTKSNDVFWRDSVLKAERGLVHSAVTNKEKILSGINKRKYRIDLRNRNIKFNDFNETENVPQEKKCDNISVYFSGYVTADFKYDSSTKLYMKNQFGKPHVDIDGKQISVTNIIVLYTSMKMINEENKLMDIELSEGDGLYVSKGGMQSIKWEKRGIENNLSFFTSSGGKLAFNAGKTYVCIVNKRLKDRTFVN